MVDQAVLSAKGNAKNAMIGTIAASGMADTWDNPGWQAFVKAYQDAFPPEKRFPSPSLLAINYYNSTAAMIEALNKVNGDLGDNQSKFKAALAGIVLDPPNGKISPNPNHQAIGTHFFTEAAHDGKGNPSRKCVQVLPALRHTPPLTP